MTLSSRRTAMALAAAACIAAPAAADFKMDLDLRFWFSQQLAYQDYAVHVEWGGDKDGLLRAVADGRAGAMIIAPDDRVAYRHFVSNDPTHGQMCLDVTNGGPFDGYVRLAKCGDYSGQRWTTKRLPHDKVTWTNEFNGTAKCLDRVVGGRDDGNLVMTACDDSLDSQAWTIGKP